MPGLPGPYYRPYYHQQQSSHPDCAPNSPTAGNVPRPESYPFLPSNFQVNNAETRRSQMSGDFDPHLYLPSYSNLNNQHQEGSHSHGRPYQLSPSGTEHNTHTNMMQNQRLGMNFNQLNQEDQHGSIQQEQHHLTMRNQMLSLHSRKVKHDDDDDAIIQQQKPHATIKQERRPHGVNQQEQQMYDFQPNGVNYTQDFAYMPIPENGSNRDPTNFQFLKDPFESGLQDQP